MAGPAAVDHRLMDDPRQRGFGDLEVHFLADLPTQSVVGFLSSFEQAAWRKPRALHGLPPDPDEDDGPAGVVDQATSSPERRAASAAECRILRWSEAGATDDRDPTEPVEGVPHPILALSGTHRVPKDGNLIKDPFKSRTRTRGAFMPLEDVSDRANKVYDTMKSAGVTSEDKMRDAEAITKMSKLPKNFVLTALQELQAKGYAKRRAREKAAGYWLIK